MQLLEARTGQGTSDGMDEIVIYCNAQQRICAEIAMHFNAFSILTNKWHRTPLNID